MSISSLRVQLVPLSPSSASHLRSISANPLLSVTVNPTKSLQPLLKCIAKKWNLDAKKIKLFKQNQEERRTENDSIEIERKTKAEEVWSEMGKPEKWQLYYQLKVPKAGEPGSNSSALSIIQPQSLASASLILQTSQNSDFTSNSVSIPTSSLSSSSPALAASSPAGLFKDCDLSWLSSQTPVPNRQAGTASSSVTPFQNVPINSNNFSLQLPTPAKSDWIATLTTPDAIGRTSSEFAFQVSSSPFAITSSSPSLSNSTVPPYTSKLNSWSPLPSFDPSQASITQLAASLPSPPQSFLMPTDVINPSAPRYSRKTLFAGKDNPQSIRSSVSGSRGSTFLSASTSNLIQSENSLDPFAFSLKTIADETSGNVDTLVRRSVSNIKRIEVTMNPTASLASPAAHFSSFDSDSSAFNLSNQFSFPTTLSPLATTSNFLSPPDNSTGVSQSQSRSRRSTPSSSSSLFGSNSQVGTTPTRQHARGSERGNGSGSGGGSEGGSGRSGQSGSSDISRHYSGGSDLTTPPRRSSRVHSSPVALHSQFDSASLPFAAESLFTTPCILRSDSTRSHESTPFSNDIASVFGSGSESQTSTQNHNDSDRFGTPVSGRTRRRLVSSTLGPVASSHHRPFDHSGSTRLSPSTSTSSDFLATSTRSSGKKRSHSSSHVDDTPNKARRKRLILDSLTALPEVLSVALNTTAVSESGLAAFQVRRAAAAATSSSSSSALSAAFSASSASSSSLHSSGNHSKSAKNQKRKFNAEEKEIEKSLKKRRREEIASAKKEAKRLAKEAKQSEQKKTKQQKKNGKEIGAGNEKSVKSTPQLQSKSKPKSKRDVDDLAADLEREMSGDTDQSAGDDSNIETPNSILSDSSWLQPQSISDLPPLLPTQFSILPTTAAQSPVLPNSSSLFASVTGSSTPARSRSQTQNRTPRSGRALRQLQREETRTRENQRQHQSEVQDLSSSVRLFPQQQTTVGSGAGSFDMDSVLNWTGETAGEVVWE